VAPAQSPTLCLLSFSGGMDRSTFFPPRHYLYPLGRNRHWETHGKSFFFWEIWLAGLYSNKEHKRHVLLLAFLSASKATALARWSVGGWRGGRFVCVV
jgi:hypothetical protein